MNILLAVDGSESSEAAVRTLIDRFRPGGTHVRVLHAVEWLRDMPMSYGFGQGPTYADDIEHSRAESYAHAGQLVSRVEGELQQAGFQTSVSTPDDDPRHAVVFAARDWPANLIVMGSHGRRGVDRFLMGSVAESVMRHAPCSVLIERAPAQRARATHEAA
jgi:nucleotide-binding universal stress UspA family protein